MSSELKNKFSLDEIARGFQAIRTTGDGGRVAFGGFKFHDLEALLTTAIDWDESLSDYERERIAFKIPFKAGESGKITREALLKALLELEAEHLSAKPADYDVVFTLSFVRPPDLRSVKVGDVQFTFFSELPKKFDRTPIRHPLYLGDMQDLPDRFVVACARVSARSVYAAYSRALTALEVLRGMWNYVINRRTAMTIRIGGFGKAEALNKIRLGPVHTVHFPDGALATKEFWHDPSFLSSKPEDLCKDSDKFRKAWPWCLRRYHTVPYQKEAANMWVRYANAFDQADREATFLKLWSLLELLTGTSGERYDETIRRTLFICDEREFHRLVLEHLRDRRNALVHNADGSSKVEQHVFQLKRYVEELLRLHLVLGKRFKSLGEFGEFLSLPADPSVLKEKQRRYGEALLFREKTMSAQS